MKTKPLTLAAIRKAFGEYVRTEGCSCCQNVSGHKAAAEHLGKLLRFKKYDDGSGYDFYPPRKEKT